MITVYRFEKDGKGPYHRENWDNMQAFAAMTSKHANKRTHPNYRFDHPGDAARYCICACPTEVMLKKWFKGHIRSIRAEGHTVYEYRLRNAVPSKSAKQVFFSWADIISKKAIM